MEESLLNWALGMLMANPIVSTAAMTVAGFMVSAFAASRAAEAIGIALRPIAKWTPWTKDDWFLAHFVWWADAVADVTEPLSMMKWRLAWAVFERVQEDYKKPLAKRRRKDGPPLK